MKIIIAGAGGVGVHLARLLTQEQQDITLIDLDEEVLEYARAHVDVLTIKGDITSKKLLKNAGATDAHLLLAVSTRDNDNIISCVLAKKLGTKNTIARVSNPEYIDPPTKSLFAEIGVDRIFSPIEFAATELSRLLELGETTDNFDFEGGKIKLIGITLDDTSSFVGKTIEEVDKTIPGVAFRAIAILRTGQTIIPRSDTVIKRSDHVYFLTSNKNVNIILKEMGKQLKKIKNVMIIGGTPVALRAAQLLQNKYNITIIEKDKETCKKLVEKLDNVLVVKGDPSNVELLKEEGLCEMDAFIGLTPNSEINIITSLMADDAGVYKTIAMVDNMDYTRLSQNIGVDTLINIKFIAANNVFRFIRKGEIEAIASLHGVDAEIIEFIINKESKITQKVLRELKFPAEAMIGIVIRGGESFVPTGDFMLKVGDKAIIFAHSIAISSVERFFE